MATSTVTTMCTVPLLLVFVLLLGDRSGLVCANTEGSTYTVVAGGRDNAAFGKYSFVGGGRYNTVADSSELPRIGTVVGGMYNEALGYGAVIGGGYKNTASGYGGLVGGGFWNTASGYLSVVSGGGAERNAGTNVNKATGDWSVVSGGHGNTASGDFSTVTGGSENKASGNNSTVLGGRANIASGSNAVAVGSWASATHTNSGAFGFSGSGSLCASQGDGSVNFCADAFYVNSVDLPSSISSNADNIAANTVSIGDNTGNITEVQADVVGIVDSLNLQQSDLTSLSGRVDSVNESTVLLSTQLADHEHADLIANASLQQAQIDALTSGVDQVSTDVSALNSRVDTVNATTLNNVDAIAVLETGQADLLTNASSQQDHINTLQSAMTAVTADTAALNARLDVVNTSVVANTAAVNAVADAASNLQQDVDSVNTTVQSNMNDIATLVSDTTDLGTRIDTANALWTANASAQQVQIDSLGSSVDSMAVDAAALSLRVDSVNTTSRDNAAAVAGLAADALALQMQVTSVNTSLLAAVAAESTARVANESAQEAALLSLSEALATHTHPELEFNDTAQQEQIDALEVTVAEQQIDLDSCLTDVASLQTEVNILHGNVSALAAALDALLQATAFAQFSTTVESGFPTTVPNSVSSSHAKVTTSDVQTESTASPAETAGPSTSADSVSGTTAAATTTPTTVPTSMVTTTTSSTETTTTTSSLSTTAAMVASSVTTTSTSMTSIDTTMATVATTTTVATTVTTTTGAAATTTTVAPAAPTTTTETAVSTHQTAATSVLAAKSTASLSESMSTVAAAVATLNSAVDTSSIGTGFTSFAGGVSVLDRTSDADTTIVTTATSPAGPEVTFNFTIDGDGDAFTNITSDDDLINIVCDVFFGGGCQFAPGNDTDDDSGCANADGASAVLTDGSAAVITVSKHTTVTSTIDLKDGLLLSECSNSTNTSTVMSTVLDESSNNATAAALLAAEADVGPLCAGSKAEACGDGDSCGINSVAAATVDTSDNVNDTVCTTHNTSVQVVLDIDGTYLSDDNVSDASDVITQLVVDLMIDSLGNVTDGPADIVVNSTIVVQLTVPPTIQLPDLTDIDLGDVADILHDLLLESTTPAASTTAGGLESLSNSAENIGEISVEALIGIIVAAVVLVVVIIVLVVFFTNRNKKRKVMQDLKGMKTPQPSPGATATRKPRNGGGSGATVVPLTASEERRRRGRARKVTPPKHDHKDPSGDKVESKLAKPLSGEDAAGANVAAETAAAAPAGDAGNSKAVVPELDTLVNPTRHPNDSWGAKSALARTPAMGVDDLTGISDDLNFVKPHKPAHAIAPVEREDVSRKLAWLKPEDGKHMEGRL